METATKTLDPCEQSDCNVAIFRRAFVKNFSHQLGLPGGTH
jgi:hypothetical protein